MNETVTFGVSSPETLRTMTGLEFIRGIMEGRLPAPPICETLDFRLVEVEPGFTVFEGAPRASHYNPMGAIHGGWPATLLDSCMACAVHTTIPQGFAQTTLEIKVNYVRPITEATGLLRAEGRVIHPGRRAATAESKLVDPAGKIYAHGTTTCLIIEI